MAAESFGNDDRLIRVSKEIYMRIAAEKTVLVPMPARTFVELLQQRSLSHDEITSIAYEYLAQEKQYARDLGRQKIQHNCTRDYVLGHSDLLMALRSLPTHHGPVTSPVAVREGPYSMPVESEQVRLFEDPERRQKDQ